MPILLLAVPLRKSWLGIHYWMAPKLMDLPVELEYIPYQELEERFAKLNRIARPIYPTPWPSIIFVLVFSALFAASAVGISQTGSALSILGQGACFILPVIAILWIRVRKETKARARKKFKHRSQKLLRAWTSQDIVTHAMQWKLRIRSQSIAKRWSHIGTGSGPTINPAPTVVTTAASLPASRNNTVIPMDLQDVEEEWAFTQDLQPDQEYMRIDFHNPMRSAPRRPAGEMTEQPVQLGQSEQSEQPEQPEQPEQRSGAEAPPVAVPRRVADVYSALHNSTSHQSQQQQQQQQQQQPPNDRVEPQSSRWEPLKDLMRDLSCCTCFFREARVWMIEISIRDGMIDEYALPVPSPIYCDYRLPGYDDVVASQAGISLTAASASLAVPGNGNGSAAMTTAPRYSVPPPAYESDSENESEDGEDDEDVDDEDEDDENRAVDSPHSNRASAIANRSHPTEAQSRSIEMTSVVISRPDSSNTSASMTSVGMTNTGFPRVGSEQSMATMTTLIEPTFTSSSAPPSASSPAPVSTRPDMGGEAGLTETDKS